MFMLHEIVYHFLLIGLFPDALAEYLAEVLVSQRKLEELLAKVN
jgi:hypothetical protein